MLNLKDNEPYSINAISSDISQDLNEPAAGRCNNSIFLHTVIFLVKLPLEHVHEHTLLDPSADTIRQVRGRGSAQESDDRADEQPNGVEPEEPQRF